jgi:hypothetical protein
MNPMMIHSNENLTKRLARDGAGAQQYVLAKLLPNIFVVVVANVSPL